MRRNRSGGAARTAIGNTGGVAEQSAPVTSATNILEQVESELAAVALRRRAARLTESLLPLLTVSKEGKELLIWIRETAARDNCSALRLWVAGELLDPMFEVACGSGSEVTELLGRLERHCLWQEAANDERWE